MTGDPETTHRASDFFEDFLSITNPSLDIVDRNQSSVKLTPPVVGALKYELKLKAPALDAPAKKK